MQSLSVGIKEVKEAAKRITPYILSTPCLRNEWLSELAGTSVLVKWENLQQTGSFKLRGALNKMIQLKEQGVTQVMAISAGNHGLGIAYTAQLLGMHATIVVPAGAAENKVAAIRRYGVELIIRGETYDEAETLARDLAYQRGIEFVSPYNDADVIAGQGTIVLEMLAQTPLDLLMVPVGGGGLLAGAAIAAKAADRDIEVIGVQAANSTAMYHSFRAGELVKVSETPTYADGLMGNIEDECVTFPIIRELVSDILLANESAIERAIINYLKYDHLVVEGASAVTAAVLMEKRLSRPNMNIGLIVSGRNIDLARLTALLQTYT
ncbi:MAG: threonine/serine dehydratase [Acidobacteriota bacterium]